MDYGGTGVRNTAKYGITGNYEELGVVEAACKFCLPTAHKSVSCPSVWPSRVSVANFIVPLGLSHTSPLLAPNLTIAMFSISLRVR